MAFMKVMRMMSRLEVVRKGHRSARAMALAQGFELVAALGDELAAGLVPPARTRMKRAAAFVFSTTLGLAGCAPTTAGRSAS